MSLEEELVRERSRSLSVGPAKAKRALSREISMTTAFKGKAKSKSQMKPTKQAKTNASISSGSANKLQSRAKDKGKTLVAATPVKPKTKPDYFHTEKKDVLPVIIDDSLLTEGRAMEGDSDDDAWMIPSSPDVLLLMDDN